MKKYLENINLKSKQVLDIVLLIVMIVFVIQNLEMVKVKFLFFGFEMPLIIIIVVAFLIGFLTSKAFPKKRNEEVSELSEKKE
jgi:uncharacterized integral membrane protein